MKTTSTTRTKIFATLLAFVLTFGAVSAQSLRPEENWLQAWKNFAGTQTASTWLHNEISNGATLFSDPTKGSLIVTVSTEWDSMDEVAEALAEGIQSGNGNQMSAGNEAEVLNHTTAITTWIGQLGGTQVYATVVAQLQQDGTTQMVLELSRAPIYPDVDARNVNALALLDSLGAEAQVSPLASESK
ncbi:MAG: hypothetical protein RLZZ519_418 [Bacteroidota bacterium]|jgi:hypothetical protein